MNPLSLRRPLDPLTLRVIRILHAIANAHAAPLLIVGATASLIIDELVHGIDN